MLIRQTLLQFLLALSPLLVFPANTHHYSVPQSATTTTMQKETPQTEIAKRILQFEEGFKDKPYLCPSKRLTIGYGFNIEDYPFTPRELEAMFRVQPLTKEAALEILNERVDDIDKWLKSTFGHKYYSLTDNRKAVLISLVFQLGRRGFLSFHKFNQAWLVGNWEKAATELFNSAAYLQTPARFARMARAIQYDDVSSWLSEETEV